MNKRELIARVQRHMGAGATRDAATAAVNAVLAAIVQQAAAGRAAIPHFGAFSYRPPRSATRRLAFAPARHLRELTTGTSHSLREKNTP